MSQNHQINRWLLSLLRDIAGRFSLGLMVMMITVAIQLSYPTALSYFIDNVSQNHNSSWYNRLAVIMLFVLLLQAVASALRYYLFESSGYLIVNKVRRILYGSLISQSIAFYDKNNVGQLNSRLTSDVEVLHNTLTMNLAISLRSCCVFIGGLTMLLLISPILSLVLLFFVPVSLYLAKWIGKHFREQARLLQNQKAECSKVAHEYMTNIRLVHAFGQQPQAEERYIQATGSLLNIALFNTRFLASFQAGALFLTYLGLLLTLYFGADLIYQGRLSIGELTSFILYAGMVTTAAGAISNFWSEWMRSIGATERLFEIINAAQITKPQDTENYHQLHGAISFQQVSFSYPERPAQQALNNLSFEINNGEKIALVGASGAGKSTIAALILGFYQPDSGRVCFDGINNQHLDINDIRRHIAIVEQEPSLFSGTIYENIAFAIPDRAVSVSEVQEAAIQANADSFISLFPEGYNTLVGDRGVQLSGGQKQRIAIARALLRNPKILILDEATSALDSASESQVQLALDKLMAGRTTIIIAHRYSTITKAERILVLQQGQLIQQGTHAQLIKSNSGFYYQLLKHQLTEDPLQKPAITAL